MNHARWAMLVILSIAAGAARAAPPSIGGCAMFPASNAWNTRIDTAPLDPASDAYIANINANGGTFVHPDFGATATYGIPWTTVGAGQAPVPMSFDYADQSDPGPYPIPPSAPVESGSDRHVLVVDTANCMLYELYAAQYLGSAAAGWHAGSGAMWDLNSNDLRPDTWTSADAAGLPILPGLARCAEAVSGVIDHALRFTVNRTQKAYVYPASHYASSLTAPDYPPMGLRLRLKAGYNIGSLTGQSRAIAQALKTYGMILADNGSNWYLSGETNPGCWNDTDLNHLKAIPGSAFEVVTLPPPSDFAGDLLANGGFEAARIRTVRPAYWTTLNNATRACDDPAASRFNADAGQCMARLVGVAGKTSRLVQTVTAPPAGPLKLQFRARPLSVPSGGATASVILTYTDATTRRFMLTLPTGSLARYQAFTLAVTPTKPVDRAQVTFSYVAETGRLWLDEVALVPGP